MMLKTHLAITIFFVLVFLPNITDKTIFIITALIATLLPDIDSGFSSVGNNIFSKIIRFLTRHRGMLHSLTFCIIISAVLAAFIPVLALGFFLGYSLHLFADSFTKNGVMPFWPYKKVSSWYFRTDGFTETGFFIVIVLIDIVAAIFTFNNYF